MARMLLHQKEMSELSFRTLTHSIDMSVVRQELTRKSLHLLIAFVPLIADALGLVPAFVLLAFGTLFYAASEEIRTRGGNVAIISAVTRLAARPRDRDRYVLGPVTLALGAMLALLLYPSLAARIAILALAFGDSASSVVGRLFGRIRIPGTGGKSLEGSLACVVAVALAAGVSGAQPGVALILGLTGAATEILPLDDFDNVAIPMSVGLVATLLLA